MGVQAATAGEPGIENFTALLDRLEEMAKERPRLTVADLLDQVGRRSFGPVLLMLGFISVSPLTVIPGATWAMAAITLLFTGQIVFGARRPWLPRRLLDLAFDSKHLAAAVSREGGANGGARFFRVAAHVADRLTAPRLRFLTDPPFVQAAALVCVMAALVTFPLGVVPLAPLLPGIAILLFGVGFTARDGAFLILAGFAVTGAFMLAHRVMQAVPWLPSF
jgi:hypothetical protein